jgi:feruloyl esterase
MLLILSLPFSAQDPDSQDINGCIPCEELMNLAFPEVLITEAVTITDKTTYCKVLGIIGKEINFELLLPGDWNGRFLMGGGGGFVDSIVNTSRWSVHEEVVRP